MQHKEAQLTAERLHSAAIRLLRLVRREDEQSALSSPRLSALSVIVFMGPLPLADLAKAEQVRPPTMTRIVDALVGQGLAVRETHGGDRRIVLIAATAEGRRLLAAARARRVRVIADRIVRLPPDQGRILAEASRLIEQLLA